MNEIDKKQKLVMIIALLGAIFTLTGITFAIARFTTISDQNLIKSGKISMSYTESSRTINLTNALPTKDELGKNSTEYFDFTIMSNADTNADDNDGIKIPYNLIIEPKAVDSDKDALTNDQIKVYLTKVESGVETEVIAPTKISELTPVDANFKLYNTENVHKNNNGTITTDYRLRAWIDYNVDASTWNQTSKQKQYKFSINVNAKGKSNIETGAERIITKVGQDGLVAESHPATTQLKATTDYRYTGANPNNYVSFNNEVWRIIGVFDVDDGKGIIEKRMKIIRKNSIGNIAWGGAVNDWSKTSGMTLLNEGEYWNRAGSYASNGLTATAKSQIEEAKWYLGSTKNYANASNGLASHFYSYERGTTVYDSTRPINWIGKVGLMYPSDYGYATSGGTTTNRAACLAKEMHNWNASEVSDCKNNDWLYDSSNKQWTLSHSFVSNNSAFNLHSTGELSGNLYISNRFAFRPNVYLTYDILITGGTGTSSDPYTLSK